jgi:hypothetical protein
MKNLACGGTRVLLSTTAPGMPHCPKKKAQYAEYYWEDDHFQMNLSWTLEQRWNS